MDNDDFNAGKIAVKNKFLTLKRKKVELINSRTECGKRCSNIFIWVKKRLVWVF